jgi:Uma2 family endonuclease
MTTTMAPPAPADTVADLLRRLGDVPPHRVRLRPPLGSATERDVVEVHVRERRICELVDGTLVEKAMGLRESAVAMLLGQFLGVFVHARQLGFLTGEAGMMRLFAGLVRIPDVAFIAWDRVPGRRMPTEPVPDLVPDLAVEVLSEGNTPAEMARKRREYFEAGVRLVWEIDVRSRVVAVYTPSAGPTVLRESDTLDGGEVLRGFILPLRQLFSVLDTQPQN